MRGRKKGEKGEGKGGREGRKGREKGNLFRGDRQEGLRGELRHPIL